ncbi:MAG: NUDIX domain-containing protein [Ruminococcaceae bacterium]|nr:NUDIX domain-containing protein [Oscillospiraceae bacterium]
MMKHPDYVQWIRSRVGHEKVMLVHAGGCIFNDRGEVLLQRRGDCDQWGFPGGTVELGETPQMAAVREVKEETGLDVLVGDLIGLYTDFDVRCSNGDQFQSILVAYKLTVTGGELFCDQEETIELKYFRLDDAPELFCKQHNDILEDVRKRKEL